MDPLDRETTNGIATSVRNLMEELEEKGREVRVPTVSEKRRSATGHIAA